jgi:hypothetical protein
MTRAARVCAFRDCSLLPVIVTWGRVVINCLIAPVIAPVICFPFFAFRDSVIVTDSTLCMAVYVIGGILVTYMMYVELVASPPTRNQ